MASLTPGTAGVRIVAIAQGLDPVSTPGAADVRIAGIARELEPGDRRPGPCGPASMASLTAGAAGVRTAGTARGRTR